MKNYSFFILLASNKYFPNPATEYFNNMIELHNDIMFFLIWLTLFLFWINCVIIYIYSPYFGKKEGFSSSVREHTILEIIWTICPIIVLITIAIPSMALLYSMNEPVEAPKLTVKITGNQWYWHYKYSVIIDWLENPYKTYSALDFDFLNNLDMLNAISFDSYMVQEADLKKDDLRLLTVDNKLVLPTKTCIRLLITSEDVIHSRAVPRLGVKMDAVPGRLNLLWLFIEEAGIYHGQCSELCGINHAFMPIVVEAVEPSFFVESSIVELIKKHNYDYFLALTSLEGIMPGSMYSFNLNDRIKFLNTLSVEELAEEVKFVKLLNKIKNGTIDFENLVKEMNSTWGIINDKNLTE